MKKIFLFLFCLVSQLVFSQVDFRNPYDASKIPTMLLPQANAVVRYSKLLLDVKDKGNATETEHKIITILNNQNTDYQEPTFYYDKFSDIIDIEASVYDATGKLVKRMKKKDIKDFKPYEYFVNDHRAKQINFPRLAFPYTIEYKVITQHKGLMHYPVWIPKMYRKEAIESASFEIKMPPNLPLRYKVIGLSDSTKTKGFYEWQLNNQPVENYENFAPQGFSSQPMILAAPNDFLIDGYEGNMSSWKNFGKFVYQLNKEKTTISPEKILFLKDLVKDCPDTMCRIQRIYAHLQETTRYFYVGFGIGGWQPAAALDTENFKYGDCKGLSNYTVSMLNAVGVPARYVLIRAGEDNQTQFPDFPNAFFNHAIACVPLAKDTIWLECTSQTESCGYLSDFTDGRPALIVTPTGGFLAKTPVYDEKINTIEQSIIINIAADGNASLSLFGKYNAIMQDLTAMLADKTPEEQRDFLYNEMNISDFEIKKLTFEKRKARIPSTTLAMELELPKFASVSGKRLFITPNVLSKWSKIPERVQSRKRKVQANTRGFTQIDNISLSIPAGFDMENDFATFNIQSEFGYYTYELLKKGAQLQLKRAFQLNHAIFPASKSKALEVFLSQVVAADNTKIVLVKL